MQNLFVNIREAKLDDLKAIMEIEGLCFPHGAWREENILYELKENPVAHFWVIELSINNEQGYQVVGFCDYWETFDSATICQIAVHPYLQRKQLGSAMMEKAISFYKKHGFKIETTKPHYYDNGDDAYYMILQVK